jgi:hypothetical protein
MKDLTKRKAIRSDAIRKAAKGEDCCVCGRYDGTTVFCHLNESWAGKGTGQKADDLGGGFFGCSSCHYLYDSTVDGRPNDADIMRAMYRTLRRLLELGVIQIKGKK